MRNFILTAEILRSLDCKTVVFFANTSDGKRRCVHVRTKGLERVQKRRGRMGRDAKKYDCPPCIYQIRSKLPVLPATGNSHWSNPDAICHQMLITPHQKDIGSRASHSRITLTAIRAFRKRPKTTVLQSIRSRAHWLIFIVTKRTDI